MLLLSIFATYEYVFKRANIYKYNNKHANSELVQKLKPLRIFIEAVFF